jgi:tyrosine-protein kinase Etk/Wzc
MEENLQRLPHSRPAPREPGGALSRWRALRSDGWFIAAVALLTSILGIVYALTLTPTYEANMLIQLKRNTPLAGEAQQNMPTATELELLRSRAVLSRVVDALQLDLTVQPKLLPVFGPLLRKFDPEAARPRYNAAGAPVGASQVEFGSFLLPDSLLGQPFLLTVDGKGGFTLAQKALNLRFDGRVGQAATIHSARGDIGILVNDINASPGAQFLISRKPRFQAVEQLQRSLVISEHGKLSNVIGVSMKGSDPQLISNILNQVGIEYVRQYQAEKTEATAKAISFYNQKLEESQKRLRTFDERLAQVIRVHGTADLSDSIRTLSQQTVALQAKLAETQEKKVELLSRLMEAHPAVKALSNTIDDLRRDIASLEAKRRKLVAAEHDIRGVVREKQIDNEIVGELFNARQKLEALALSNNVSVRVVDRAEPPVQPVTLRFSAMVVLACLAGIVVGLSASFFKTAMVHAGRQARDVDGTRAPRIGADSQERDILDDAQRRAGER